MGKLSPRCLTDMLPALSFPSDLHVIGHHTVSAINVAGGLGKRSCDAI
jgi:hypothetical protein